MLTHYIIVRNDLPLGVLAAMVTHASGESAALYENNHGDFNGATAVVLEATSEDNLFDIRDELNVALIDYVEVFESGGPYHDQFMAIGVIPGERNPVMKPYKILKTCLVDNPVAANLSLENANETT